MNNSQTQKYAFILGRERELCLAELEAVLARFDFCFGDLIVSGNVVFINFDLAVSQLAVSGLANILGGTVKIFRVISTPRLARVEKSFDSPEFTLSEVERALDGVSQQKDLSATTRRVPFGARDDSKYIDLIKEYVRTHQKNEGKFNYGISSYSRAFNQKSVNNLGLSIKKDLKKELSLRFVEIREGQEVSSILSLKSKLATEGFEFGIFESGEIGILIGLSNPEEWGERDYGKPAGDKYSGMTPPKLARMMINLTLGQINPKSEAPNSKQIQNPNLENSKLVSDFDIRYSSFGQRPLVVDPFCGSGNILLEALMLGIDVFGSDNSEKAVQDSKKNVQWLINTVIPAKAGIQSGSQIKPACRRGRSGMTNRKVEIVQTDATNNDLIQKLSTFYSLPSTYDSVAVVTEPYLGEPKKYKPSMNAVRGEYNKIKELYLDFLMNFKNFLTLQTSKMPTAFCLIFPLVETAEGKRFSLFADSVDEIRKIGYTTIRPPLIYGRDYQVVKRQIVLLKYR